MASKRKPKGYYTSSFDTIRKAQQLLDECDVRSVPVNLVSLARHQGIKQIKEMDTRLDGQLLELEDGGYEVILSKNASVARKRFTLAHEIAHTLFAGQDSEGLACGEEAVEELCNAAAAEILIPSRFLQKTFPRGKEVTVESILEVTRLFECSLEAAAWRLLNSGLIEGALLIWRLNHRSIISTQSVGVGLNNKRFVPRAMRPWSLRGCRCDFFTFDLLVYEVQYLQAVLVLIILWLKLLI